MVIQLTRQLKDIDVVILSGGLGTRLRPTIKDKPKGLAPVNGRPFLDILVDNLLMYGFHRFVFCVGYLGKQIIRHFGERDDCQIVFSVEEIPLGTGGAIKNAKEKINSDIFLVLNGDSFCEVDYHAFLEFHINNRASISIVLTNVDEARDFGSVIIDHACRMVSFNEKAKNESCLINAGIYLLERRVLTLVSEEQTVFSLERDFFPKVIEKYPCYGYEVSSRLWDIGTSERYKKACRHLADRDTGQSAAFFVST